MFFLSIAIIIAMIMSAIVAPVGGFRNGESLRIQPRPCSYQRTAMPFVDLHVRMIDIAKSEATKPQSKAIRTHHTFLLSSPLFSVESSRKGKTASEGKKPDEAESPPTIDVSFEVESPQNEKSSSNVKSVKGNRLAASRTIELFRTRKSETSIVLKKLRKLIPSESSQLRKLVSTASSPLRNLFISESSQIRKMVESETFQRLRRSFLELSQKLKKVITVSRKSKRETTAVDWLMLVCILSFIGDNVFHLPVFQSLYLHHRKWGWWQPITCTFCHGNWAHLNGNIFLLLLFGRSVEDELGPVGLLVSYMFCGIVANLVSLATLPQNTVSLGASGAVFGLFSLSVFSKLSWEDVPDWRKIAEVGVLGHFVANQGATMSLFQNDALSAPKKARIGQFVGNLFRNGAKTAAAGGFAGAEHVAHLAGAGAGVAMAFLSHRWISVK